LSQTTPYGEHDDMAGITHIVWPEAAMPFLPLEHPEALTAIGGLLNSDRQLIAGGLRLDGALRPDGTPLPRQEQKGFNSLMVFKAGGKLAALYDKIHLVPFGEYLPFEPVLSALGLTRLAHGHGAFATGKEPRPLLSVAGLPPVGGLICYEVLFPGAVVQGQERPGVLINLTNDGWFGNSTGPQQHFHQTRIRAVEEGVPVVRVANNGVSGVIDSYGRVLQKLELNARGTIDSALPAAIVITPYARLGDLPLVILMTLTGLFAAVLGRRS
jgi:apolipoprotein N-acyltransferase